MSYSTSKEPSGWSVADAGQPETPPLVAHVHAVLGVVDGVEPDHALVDVGAGVVHRVVVEPEEALLLPVVATGRPVQVEVVDPRPRVVAPVLGARTAWRSAGCRRSPARCGRCAGGSGSEPSVRPEVLPVQAERILVQVVLEADQGRPAVLGVDHRPREGAVEAVDRARRAACASRRPRRDGPPRRRRWWACRRRRWAAPARW